MQVVYLYLLNQDNVTSENEVERSKKVEWLRHSLTYYYWNLYIPS